MIPWTHPAIYLGCCLQKPHCGVHRPSAVSTICFIQQSQKVEVPSFTVLSSSQKLYTKLTPLYVFKRTSPKIQWCYFFIWSTTVCCVLPLVFNEEWGQRTYLITQTTSLLDIKCNLCKIVLSFQLLANTILFALWFVEIQNVLTTCRMSVKTNTLNSRLGTKIWHYI